MAAFANSKRTQVICRCSRCAFNARKSADHEDALERAWKFRIFMAGWTAATRLCQCEDSECAAIEVAVEDTPCSAKESSSYSEVEVLPASANEVIEKEDESSFESKKRPRTPPRTTKPWSSSDDDKSPSQKRRKSETWSGTNEDEEGRRSKATKMR